MSRERDSESESGTESSAESTPNLEAESEFDARSDSDIEPDRRTATESEDPVVSFDGFDDGDSDVGFDDGDGERSTPTDGQQTDRRESPLGELADTVAARESRPLESDVPLGSEPHEGSDAAAFFEREDVEGIDREALWEQVQREDTDGFDATETVHPDREIREIQKRDYCHGCEYFERPPNVGCTHAGTDILEFRSLETVRVADCPVVLEDEALEERG